MKIVMVVAVLACCAFSAAVVFAEEQTVSMNVEKMTCALCPVTVRIAMERVDGVQDVDVNLDTNMATVTFDDAKTTALEIAQASTDAGFPATPVAE